MKQIHEVLRRSFQGITGPFLCRDEDQLLCFVKGRAVGYRGLCCEWIGGRIAQALELPIPEFDFVAVPEPLVRASAIMDINQLGCGPAFASYEIPEVTEPIWEDVQDNSNSQARQFARILLFDWWTCNPDRVLGSLGGNPNMLWSALNQRLWIIDHNLCFSPEHPNMAEFWEDHAFREFVRVWEPGWVDEMSVEMRAIREQVPLFWDQLPDEWIESTALNLQEIDDILERMQQSDFWKVNR